MMDVKKVVKKIVDYKQQNSHLKEVTLDNEVVYAPFPKDKKKNNYGFMVFSEEETEIKSDCKYKHRYYYYEEFNKKNGKNIIFIMLNPSTACPHKDDPTIRNCRTLAEKKYKSMEIINLFSERRSKKGKFTDDVFDINLDFIEEFLTPSRYENPAEQEVVIAWGYAIDTDYPIRINNIMEKLEDFAKMKITIRRKALIKAQKLARHPNQPFWKGFGDEFVNIAKFTKY